MIKIPFDRCVILTTLDYAQITNRLASAIYDPSFSSESSAVGVASQNENRAPKQQRYFGQIQGFKFLANRIIGHRYWHLPAFLTPTIAGKIDSLYRGYEISLTIELNSITFALLLTWLGGLLTTISSVVDNALTSSKNYQYLTTMQIIIGVYLLIIAYFYFEAWRATRYFRTLFIKELVGSISSQVVDRSTANANFDYEPLGDLRSTTSLLRQNLPSFPARPSADFPTENARSITTLLRQNLPSFPHRSTDIHPADRPNSPQ
jgi:hypothetical protein